ncbi:hypothetical protein BTO30_03295 [Domibacillus antri]|uniref:GGDEF domain-containing protein n=1 Tax=Domibacillus antri TaxID=1714264 RepID=A0A1Q8Q8E9_9BACI|nr:MHYT domain-containing protein [Domibacillus antri]OLN23608.1 hypothetical protein BTO30_03295 [Domibacillus antri]
MADNDGHFIGLTIWTMHFVSMMSFSLPIPIEYKIPFTIASIIPAVLAAYAAFYTLYKLKRRWWTFSAASIITGFGVVLMHYSGMAAIIVDAKIVYDSMYILLSVVIAAAAAYSAIQFFNYFMHKRGIFWKIITSLLLGSAISGMHYIGMQSADFYVPEGFTYLHQDHSTPGLFIALIILPIGMIFIFMTALSVLDRKTAIQLAYTDDLTNLPNRRGLEQFIHTRTVPLNLPIAVVIIDIDNFKRVNETYGYESGNKFALAIPGTFSRQEIRTLLAKQY